MLKEFITKPYLKKRKNNSTIKRDIIIFPKYKKLSIPKKKNTRYNSNVYSDYDNSNTQKLNTITNNNIKNRISSTSMVSLDNSRQDLINTIKNFLTEPSDDFHKNLSNINISPSPDFIHKRTDSNKLNMKKRTVCKVQNNYKKINKNLYNGNTYADNIKRHYINNLLFKRKENLLNSHSNTKKVMNRNRLNSNSSYNSIIDNYYSHNSYNNSLKNINCYSLTLESEIEKKLKEIERLKLSIKNISKKIELMKYDLNMNNNYFKQINKQCLKVLYNSKTIKAIQKSFDKEIPKIKGEIDEIKNKIYLYRKENEINNVYAINANKDIEMKKAEIDDVELLNDNLKNEVENIKTKIFLVQSLNKNIKILISKNIFS